VCSTGKGVKDVAEICAELGPAVLRGCTVRKEWPNPDAVPRGNCFTCMGTVLSAGVVKDLLHPGPHQALT